MRNKILEIFKGLIIGISTMIPGFSGGLIAVSFNVYDKIINALGDFFKSPFKVIKEIWALALGVGIGILVSIIGLAYLLSKVPIPATFLFLGLIIGSIPIIYKKTNKELFKPINLLNLFLGILVIIGFMLLSIFSNNEEVTIINQIGFKELTILFFVGILIGIISLLPGGSVSLILFAIGYYTYILDFIMAFIMGIIEFDLTLVLNNLYLIIALGLGITLGLIATAKGLSKFIKKYPVMFYSLVLGLLIISPIAIIYHVNLEYIGILEDTGIITWIIGVVLFGIGITSSIYLDKLEEKITKTKEEDVEIEV